MIVTEKPSYLVSNMLTAQAMAHKLNGKVEKIYMDDEFIGFSVVKNGELI